MNFTRDERGAFAVWFALVSGMILMGVGMAVDYTRLTNLRSGLQDAADSAALAAVSLPNLKPTDLAATVRNDIAKRVFSSNSSTLGIDPVKPILKSELVNGRIKVTVGFDAIVPLLFDKFLPGPTKHVGGNAVAASTKMPDNLYNAIYFIIDNSASMGIGQTAADSMAMVSDKGVKAYSLQKYGNDSEVIACSVACHQSGNDTYSYYRTKKNIKMRIDVAVSAIDNFVKSIELAGADKYTKFSINTTDDTYSATAGSFETSIADVHKKLGSVGLSANYVTRKISLPNQAMAARQKKPLSALLLSPMA
jgi:Putative Flp pilus-assembly TadE/G-like